MLFLQAKKRKMSAKKIEDFKEQEKLLAVLYGPEIKSEPLVLDLKEFEKIYEQAGENMLI